MSLPDVSVEPTAAPTPRVDARWRTALDRGITAAGVVVSVAAAIVTALVEIFFAPLRVGGMLVGVSVVLAVVLNIGIVFFTVAATGARWTVLLPALAWFAIMIVASARRTEGDLLLPATNWVGLATIFAGAIAYGIAAYRLILRS